MLYNLVYKENTSLCNYLCYIVFGAHNVGAGQNECVFQVKLCVCPNFFLHYDYFIYFYIYCILRFSVHAI